MRFGTHGGSVNLYYQVYFGYKSKVQIAIKFRWGKDPLFNVKGIVCSDILLTMF